ncbi:hypothetical protein ACVBEH_08955, partial [Roseateles sp. GG27B]
QQICACRYQKVSLSRLKKKGSFGCLFFCIDAALFQAAVTCIRRIDGVDKPSFSGMMNVVRSINSHNNA